MKRCITLLAIALILTGTVDGQSYEYDNQSCFNVNETVQNDYGEVFGLIDDESISHFLSQVAHESGGLVNLTISENLNYSSAQRLVDVWPSRFSLTDPDLTDPLPFVNNPEALADFVYSNRMGNGDAESGDGWLYRGRGIMQITGFNNYNQFNEFYQSNISDHYDFVNNPNLLSDNSQQSIFAAMWFFNTNVLNRISNLTVERVTRAVNGGDHGLDDRTNYFNNAMEEIEC